MSVSGKKMAFFRALANRAYSVRLCLLADVKVSFVEIFVQYVIFLKFFLINKLFLYTFAKY